MSPLLPLVALAVTVIVGGVLYGLLVAHLRRFHPQVWKDLGEPHVLLAASTRRSTVGEFVWKQSYRVLADKKLTRLAVGMRFLTLLAGALFVLGVLAVF